MNFVLWIIFGAIAGWIMSIIMERNAQMDTLANIVVGIVGALFGGFIMNAFGAQGVTGFNLTSLIVAILGAVVLLFLVGLVRQPDKPKSYSPAYTQVGQGAHVTPQDDVKRVKIVSDFEPYDVKVRLVVGSGVGADYEYEIKVKVVAESDPNYDWKIRVAERNDFRYEKRVKVVNPEDIPMKYGGRWYG